MVPWFSLALSGRAVQAWLRALAHQGCSAIAQAASAAKKLRYTFYPSSVRLSRSNRLVPTRASCRVTLTTFMRLSPCHDHIRIRKHAATLDRRGTDTRFTQDLDLPALVSES